MLLSLPSKGQIMATRIIETFPKGVAKDKPSNMATPKAKAPKGLGNTQAVENREGEESGFKKKRLHAVEKLSFPK
jgi:hypothetical protein